MNDNEEEAQRTVSSKSPSPPPFPDFLFSTILQIPKLFDCNIHGETTSFEEAVKRVTNGEGFFFSIPFYSVNSYVQSQLQHGPRCGLVALSMATSITGNFKSAYELFDEAVKRGFTTQGEMFSAENLASLVESTTRFKAFVLRSGLNSHIDCIFHCIQNGGLMLVPYDADYNHKPCCRRGHNAHWAIITGIVIFKVKDPEDEEEDYAATNKETSILSNPELYSQCQCVKTDVGNFFNRRPNGMKLIRRDSIMYFTRNEESLQNVKKCKIYVAGKQGKSRHLALWSFEELAESNDNLTELSEYQRGKNFTIPAGGVSSGLKGKAVLLHMRR